MKKDFWHRIYVIIFLLIVLTTPFGIGAISHRKDAQPPQVMNVSFKMNGRPFSLLIPKGSSVYSAMKLAQRAKKISFSGKEFSGLGFFVEEINGIKSDYWKGMYWIYYINGKKANVGISSYIVSSGDAIEWKYGSNQ